MSTVPFPEHHPGDHIYVGLPPGYTVPAGWTVVSESEEGTLAVKIATSSSEVLPPDSEAFVERCRSEGPPPWEVQ